MQIRIARTVSCQELTPQNTRPLYFQEYLILYTKSICSIPKYDKLLFDHWKVLLSIFQETNHQTRPAICGCGVSKAGYLSQFKDEPRERSRPAPEKWMVERNLVKIFFQQFFSWELICKIESMFFSNILFDDVKF